MPPLGGKEQKLAAVAAEGQHGRWVGGQADGVGKQQEERKAWFDWCGAGYGRECM